MNTPSLSRCQYCKECDDRTIAPDSSAPASDIASSALGTETATRPKTRLACAREVRRRPRPPGSSWLLDPDLNLGTLCYDELQQRRRLISLAKRPPDAPILSRKAFTNEQRRAVCAMALADDKISHKDLANLFGTTRYTIMRTLRKMDQRKTSDPSVDAKATRNRRPTHLILDFELGEWAWKCMKDGVLISDAMIRAKALESAKEHHLLDQRVPFVCSPKWIRGLKSRLRILDGKIIEYEQTKTRRDESGQSSTPELYSAPPEGPGTSLQDVSPQPLADMTANAETATRGALNSYPSPMLFRSADERPHADANTLFPPISMASTSSPAEGTEIPFVGVQDASLLMAEHATSLSYQSPSPQSSPELYTPDWRNLPELAATAGQYKTYDGMYDAPVLDLQSGSSVPWDMDPSLAWTDQLVSGLPALPDMQTSCLPLLAGYSTTPAIYAPPDYSIDMTPTGGAAIDAGTFANPSPDLPVPSSSMWSTYTPPAITPSLDVSAPSIPPTDPSSLFASQSCVPQEDIDRLAAEMMHWPIEALLDDISMHDISMPMSQGQVAYPSGDMLFGAPMPSDWARAPLDGLGNTGFVPA